MNTDDDSAVDISWAINDKGHSISLLGIYFMKIYTGVNQESEWLGECYTDIANIGDLHLLGVDINSIYYISFFCTIKQPITIYHRQRISSGTLCVTFKFTSPT